MLSHTTNGMRFRTVVALFRDRLLLCLWVLCYPIILSIFGVLKKFESREPIPVDSNRGKYFT